MLLVAKYSLPLAAFVFAFVTEPLLIFDKSDSKFPACYRADF